ncbi:HPr family phosphocarrier protein [Bacillus sp. B1-b2]|uniref:HPr family phosphocarrier protein n=1 Tax=Bacillus sp. B1-b2 TaxID=2653201 RepID=UPI00186A8205|nr:HPr family phosphocarrier protein [Bacillus sp. B1-b2]
MLIVKLTVKLPQGLQARNTIKFVQKACSFSSTVFLTKNGRLADGKEALEVLNLNINSSEEISLIVNGRDEEVASDYLKALLLNKIAI